MNSGPGVRTLALILVLGNFPLCAQEQQGSADLSQLLDEMIRSRGDADGLAEMVPEARELFETLADQGFAGDLDLVEAKLLVRAAVDLSFEFNDHPDLEPPDELLELALDSLLASAQHPQAAYVAFNLIKVLRDLGQHQRARTLSEQAIDWADFELKPWLLLDRAVECRDRGDWVEAAQRLQEASEDRAGATRSTQLEAQIAGEWAHYHLSLGCPEQAWRWIQKEKRLVKDDPNRWMRQGQLLHELIYWLAIDDHPKLISRVDESLELEFVTDDFRPRLLLKKGLALVNLSERPGAMMSECRAILQEALSQGLPENEALFAETTLAWLDIDDPSSQSDLWLDQGRRRLASWDLADDEDFHPRRGFLALLSCRRRSVLEGTSSELLEETRGLFRQFVEHWMAAPILPNGIGLLHMRETRSILGIVLKMMLTVDHSRAGTLQALQCLSEAQACGSLERKLGLPIPTIRQIESLVPTGGGLIVQVPMPEHTLILVLDGEEPPQTFEHTPDFVLSKKRKSFIERLRFGREEELRSEGQEFLGLLWPAELQERMKNWRTITTIGLDLLGWVPLESLPWQEEWLGTRFAVSSLPSLVLGAELDGRVKAQAEQDRSLDLALFASPQHSQAARTAAGPPLDSHRESIRQLTAFPKTNERSRSFVDSAATLESLRATVLQTRVLHLFTHGLSDFTRTDSSGFILSPSRDHDGRIFSQDLQDVMFPSVVCLSACRAGAGPPRMGDGGMTPLISTLFQNGASALSISQAALDVDSSAWLTERMTGYMIEDGCSPAEALRRARTDVMNEPGWESPRFHGLLTVIGAGHHSWFEAATPRTTAMSPWLWWGVSGGGLLVFLLIRRRPRSN